VERKTFDEDSEAAKVSRASVDRFQFESDFRREEGEPMNACGGHL
jgi:hypothetical protein